MVLIQIMCAIHREVTKHPLEIIVLDTCCMKRLLDSNTKRQRDGRIFTIPRLYIWVLEGKLSMDTPKQYFFDS